MKSKKSIHFPFCDKCFQYPAWTISVDGSLKDFHVCPLRLALVLNFKKCFIFERQRERNEERERTGEGHREGDTESEAGSRLSAESPMWGSNP